MQNIVEMKEEKNDAPKNLQFKCHEYFQVIEAFLVHFIFLLQIR